jgi:hypothetical protein
MYVNEWIYIFNKKNVNIFKKKITLKTFKTISLLPVSYKSTNNSINPL